MGKACFSMVIGSLELEAEVVVIGAGPGGYVAALRAADLGKEVVLVEERDRQGGVCLIEGCIPSKALIHAVEAVHAAKEAEAFGLTFEKMHLDTDRLRAWTGSVVDGLTNGVKALLKNRDVQVVQGRAAFTGSDTLSIAGGASSTCTFKHAIIATGSRVNVPAWATGLDIWTSVEALKLPEVPESLLVVGGGYIGLELGLVYAGLGSKVTLVEMTKGLLPGCDRDLVQPVLKRCKERFGEMLFEAVVTGATKVKGGYEVEIEQGGKKVTKTFSRIFAAIGRKPNTDNLGLAAAGVKLDERGLVEVDEQCRTSNRRIFAIGDVTPGFALAHKASRQGKVVAEVIAGQPSAFDNRVIPAVVFTDPEVAWAGLTETEAQEKGIAVKVGKFPLTALGRAKTMGRTEGSAKVISDPESGLVLGVGIVAAHASDLIAEAALAIELGATVEDLCVTIHPHPTLSEAVMEAAEAVYGHGVHVMARR